MGAHSGRGKPALVLSLTLMAQGAEVAVVVLSAVSGRARRVDGALGVWIEASFALQSEGAMRSLPHPGFRSDSLATRDQAPDGFYLSVRPVGTEMVLLGVDGRPITDMAGHDERHLPMAPASGGLRVAGIRSSWPEVIGAARVYSATAAPRDMPMRPVAVDADAGEKRVRILWFASIDAADLASVTVGVALEEAGRPYPWPPTLASAKGAGVASLEGTLVISGPSSSPTAPPEANPLESTMAVRGKPPSTSKAPFALAPAGSSPGPSSPTPGAPWSSEAAVPVPASTHYDGTVALAGHSGGVADEVAAAQRKLETLEAEARAEAERKALEQARAAEERAKRERREAARKAFEAEQEEARRREAERIAAEARAEKARAKKLMKSVYGGFKK